LAPFQKLGIATFLFLTIFLSYLIPSATILCLAEDEWVTIFEQDYSKINIVPINVYTTFNKGIDPTWGLSKRAEDNYLLITKKMNETGSVIIYGLTPSIRCRYIIELDWTNSHLASWSGAGVQIFVGAVRLHCYTSGTGSRFYLRGQYYNASDAITSAFLWDLGKESKISLTIDVDTSLGKAYVSDKNNIAELPFYRYSWVEDYGQNTFTPDTIALLPFLAQSAELNDSTVIKLFKVTQKVRAPSTVTAIGSTKYQAYGYDGPHPASTVAAGMDQIRDANMNATIFADVGYTKNPTYLQYLKGLIADGWELGIHFSVGLSTLPYFENATIRMVKEYAVISELFGTPPLSWCSLGNLDNATYALWAKNNLNMIYRSLRVIPQNVPGSSDITGGTFDYWLGAVKSCVSTVPIYIHETEVEPATTSSIDASKFDLWLSYVFTNGVRLTGYYKWYMINSNQLDARFISSTDGSTTTIAADTNGYNAIILVKIKADSTTTVKSGNELIEYSISPEGYLVFEVEDDGGYIVTTKTNIQWYNNLSLYLVSLATLIIIIILVVKTYNKRTSQQVKL
jgi:hypothetical protein